MEKSCKTVTSRPTTVELMTSLLYEGPRPLLMLAMGLTFCGVALMSPGQSLRAGEPLAVAGASLSNLGAVTVNSSSLTLAAARIPLPQSNPKRLAARTPLPQRNPRRIARKETRQQDGNDPIAAILAKQDAGQDAPEKQKPAQKTVQKTHAVPPPAANPLRRLASRSFEVRHQTTSLVIPSLPDRAGGVPNRLRALAPLLHYRISKRDIERLNKSIELVLRNRLPEAIATKRTIADPTARKLAHWYYLRKALGMSDPMAMERFRRINTDWPSRSLLRRRTERALLETNPAPAIVKRLYHKGPPTTGIGKYLLARAHLQSGHGAKALKLAREVWRRHSIGAKMEMKFLKDFGSKLTRSDHLRRADHFLYKDKKRALPSVRRVRKLLKKADQDRINLRMEVIKRRNRAASKEYAKLGRGALKNTGLLFNRIQLLRRKEKYAQAWALLKKAPTSTARLAEPDEWWIERRVQTRYALRKGNFQAAYDIASRHGEISRKHTAEAEFLAGWIALSRLKKPELALEHFKRQRRSAANRRDIAKAEYWLGRAKSTLSDKIGALAHYTNASKYYRTYYGQLALQAVERSGSLRFPSTPAPQRKELKRFVKRDAVRALVIAHKAGLDSITPLFFSHLAWRLKNPGEMALLAELATQIHSKRGSVMTGKVGVYRGFKLDRYAYPVNAMPPFNPITAPVDPAFVLALTRQESEFNAKAKSHVGARGMMQIMPGTARLIARQHRVRYSRARLTSDPSYNVTLGVAHLHDLITQYNGSYVFTLVAYNAGPRRVSQWIEAFGDPRTGEIDMIDWIESIPFTETRRYVKRIMSSTQIFRNRLDAGKGRIQLLQDINRGRMGAGGEIRKSELDTNIQ